MIKVPGPDHPITIERNLKRVVVSAAGRVIADTRSALTLHEAHYPPVQYIPRKDVDMALLARTDRITYCPYKGDASYFSIPQRASARSTRSGPTRHPMRRSPTSRTTSLFIPTASTPLRFARNKNRAGKDRIPGPVGPRMSIAKASAEKRSLAALRYGANL